MEKSLVHSLSLGKVSGLYRHAVKGLSADSLQDVQLNPPDAFPDDRLFALMKKDSSALSSFDPENPEWIHKENFLCVFTDPHLMARYRTSYDDETKQLTLWDRSTEEKVLGPVDMSIPEEQEDLAAFFSKQAGIPLVCVTGKNHQFGNTSKGWSRNKDTRTIHIVHRSTVKALEEAIGVQNLDPTQFRPNIVLEGGSVEPFCEFDWVGKTIQCGSTTRLDVISKAVRCRGVGLDPLKPGMEELDIPSLLAKHFPKQGPYLGVYAVVSKKGTISLEDEITLL